MDVKEIIKWLFQVKDSNSSNVKSGRFENSSKMCLSFVLLTVFLCSFVGCKAEQKNNSVHTNFSSLNSLNNGEQFNVDSKFDSSQSRSSSLLDDDQEKKEEFEDATGIFKMIRAGANYLDQKLEGNIGNETARTFGRPIKKLQAMMIPLMFGAGILSTIIVLTFKLALKAVIIGKILLVLKIIGALGKLFYLKQEHGGHDSGGKEVHVHLHNSPTGHAVHDYGHDFGQPFQYPSVSYGAPSSHSAWSRRDPAPQLAVGVNNANGYAAAVPTALGPGVINTPYGHYVRTGPGVGGESGF